jgi:hypothetical protein
MHPILEEFLEDWVYPTAFGGPSVKFRLRITEEKLLDPWSRILEMQIKQIEMGLDSGNENWKRDRAYAGYAGEGIQASVRQMSTQLLSIDIADQENFIDLQRMRARQLWDECKHSKLHAEVLLGKGWIDDEAELMTEPLANTQPLNAYFGMSNMFPYLHPVARAAQNYCQEANAVMGIMAHMQMVDDPLVQHENQSQRDEEMMHFLEGKYQIEFYCTTPETQQIVEDGLDWLISQMWRAAR